MPQLTYTNDIPVALAGMLADSGTLTADITSYPASEVIPAGRACVLTADGKAALPKNTGALPESGTGSLLGVSVYTSASPAGGYQIGDMVPLVRKGRIWADFEGTLATENEAVNIRHSSTVATHRGKFTDAAPSTSGGVEITAFSKGIARGNSGAGLALIDINLP